MNTFDAKIEPLILYRNRQKVSEIDKHQLRSANEVALFCILQTIYVILDINAIKSSALEIDFNCVHAVYQRQTAIIQIVSIICCVQNQPWKWMYVEIMHGIHCSYHKIRSTIPTENATPTINSTRFLLIRFISSSSFSTAERVVFF